MKISNIAKDEIEGILWYWDNASETILLNPKYRILMTMRDMFFAEKVDILEGFATVDDSLGKLFYCRNWWKAGSPSTFLLLKNGRVWFISHTNIGSANYGDLIRKIISNPEIIATLDSIDTVRAAVDLILE